MTQSTPFCFCLKVVKSVCENTCNFMFTFIYSFRVIAAPLKEESHLHLRLAQSPRQSCAMAATQLNRLIINCAHQTSFDIWQAAEFCFLMIAIVDHFKNKNKNSIDNKSKHKLLLQNSTTAFLLCRQSIIGGL